MTKNEVGLDRTVEQSFITITIYQWNQVLIKAKRVGPGRIVLTKSTETIHPSDFVTLANWAYQIDENKPDSPPDNQRTTEP